MPLLADKTSRAEVAGRYPRCHNSPDFPIYCELVRWGDVFHGIWGGAISVTWIGKSSYVVVAESSFTAGILGERVNIVMYDREISLLARFSKMTARVPNFNYCKARRKTGQEQCPLGELFLVGQLARRSLVVFWGRKPGLLLRRPTTKVLAQWATRRRSTVASPQGRLTWFLSS